MELPFEQAAVLARHEASVVVVDLQIALAEAQTENANAKLRVTF